MSDNAIGLIVLVCIFGASLLGMLMRPALSQHHLSADTKDSVKLGMGLVGTMAALILGLLVAAAKSAYDTEKNEVTQMAAKLVFLDRVLANYGPESADTRVVLRRMVEDSLDRMWPDERSHNAQLDPIGSGGEEVHKAIQKLAPRNDVQGSLKSQAVGVVSDLGQMRWLLFEQSGSSISMPLLIVVISWLAIIFFSWGLFAPSNSIAIAALLLAAVSVSGAIFLILELRPAVRRVDPYLQRAHAQRPRPSRQVISKFSIACFNKPKGTHVKVRSVRILLFTPARLT